MPPSEWLFKALEKAAEEVLLMPELREIPHVAVNWADFHCTGVSWVLEYADGRFLEAGFRVSLTEGSRDNASACSFVQKELNRRGFDVIDVACEW